VAGLCKETQSRGKTRVLLLGPLPPPFGGPEIMTEVLLEGLRKHGQFSIRHVDTQVSRSLAEKGGKKQLRKSMRAIGQVVRVMAFFVSFRPDVLYLPLTNSPSFWGFLRDAVLMLPGLLIRTRVVVRLHGGRYLYAGSRGLKRAVVRTVLGRVSVVMVQGERLTSVFGELVKGERVVVVPNGLDWPAAERDQRHRNGEGIVSKRVLFVGLMCREKGFHDVIAAVPLVPDGEFVFAGEWASPDDERETREFLRREGATARVVFSGVVSGADKYRLFASADVFVLPSYFAYEGHAVSSVEALAAALPIVCTDHGALNESVRDGWNGYFVSRSDPEAIAERLNRLLKDDGLRRAMGARSRRLYRERFTLRHFAKNWSEAILRAMSGT